VGLSGSGCLASVVCLIWREAVIKMAGREMAGSLFSRGSRFCRRDSIE
jgi:hypothetical protein